MGDRVQPPRTRRSGPRPGDLLLRAGSVRPLLVFKALQLLQCRGLTDPLQDYVAFDLETTEMDAAACDIVELAAVRVRGRVIVDQFQRLVRPSRPISPRAIGRARLSGRGRMRPADVRGGLAARSAPSSATTCWWRTTATPSTCPCSAGSAAGLPGIDDLVFFDTLPLARSLMDESARLEDLAHRFGVARGRSHHALDDAATLVGVARHLGELRLVRARKTALVQLLGWLGLALALDDAADPSPEERLLRDARRCPRRWAGTAAASRPTPSRPPAPTRPRRRS